MVRLTLHPDPQKDGKISPVSSLFADIIVRDGKLLGDAGRWAEAILAKYPGCEIRVSCTAETQIGVATVAEGKLCVKWTSKT